MDERRKQLLKAKISVALMSELGRVPKPEEIDRYFLAAKVLYKAVLGLHFERRIQKRTGQIPLF